MKRTLSLLLIFCLIFSLLPATVAQAAEQPVTVLFGSDFQNNCYHPNYNRYYYDNTPLAEQPRSISLKALLGSVADAGVTPDAALFVGDYTDHFQEDGNADYCAGDGIRAIRSMLDDAFGTTYSDTHSTIFTQGNHDYAGTPELAESGLQPYTDQDAYLVYVINERDFPYRQSSSMESTITTTARHLRDSMTALAEQGESRPIFVLCHVPLHYSSRYNGGDNPYANLIFDALNEPAADLNVFVFFGHNHSGASADYEWSWGGAVNYVARGQKLDINSPDHDGTAGSNAQTINFTYMNAGYIGYSTSGTNSTRTLSLLSIYENRVTIARYDENGEYTAVESIGQTDPRDKDNPDLTNYPITVPLHVESSYPVSVVSANPFYGTVTLENGHAVATANPNYVLDGWSLDPPTAATVVCNGNEFYFSDLQAACTLTVSFREVKCLLEGFSDLEKGRWYHDGVDYALSRGLFNGIGEGVFSPDGTMNRAMLVTVLYRLEGSPVLVPGTDFTDVPTNRYYSRAVTWAKLRGIVNGVGDGRFAPEDNVSREEAATILYRYAAYKKYALADGADLTAYLDNGSVSNYAKTALSWAVAEDLINGVEGQRLDPRGSATRAQVAVILARFCVNVAS